MRYLEDRAAKDALKAGMVHEIGHFLNLYHSVLNHEQATDGDATNDVVVPSMFPLSVLDDAALASVLNWRIGRFGPQAASEFTGFDADEVARYRSRPLLDVEATRHELLRQLDGLAQ